MDIGKFFREKIKEIIFIVFLALLFLFINVPDLNSWKYSIIGDEYGFYMDAKNFKFSLNTIFSQKGVFGYHPVLSTFYQSIIMKVLGEDNFGWRMSSVLIVILTIPALYFFVKNFYGRRVAIFSSLLFSSAFYFFGYAHTGYNNIQSTLPFAYSLWFFSEAEKNRESNVCFYLLTGLFCGLGWYTFYTSRITIFLVIFYILLRVIFKHLDKKILFGFFLLLLGFFSTVFPLFKIEGMEVFKRMKEQSILNPSLWGIYVDDPILRFQENFKLNILSFFIGGYTKHFVTTPLFDPISQLLIFFGFAMVLLNLNKFKYLFLFFSYIFLIAMVAFNPIKEIVLSRMQIPVLMLTIVGGVGWEAITKLINKRNISIRTVNLLNVIVSITILILNIKIFFIDIPQKYPYTSESIVIKAIQESPVHVALYENDSEKFFFEDVIKAYHLEKKVTYVNENNKVFLPQKPFLFVYNKERNWIKKVLGTNPGFPCVNGKVINIGDFQVSDRIEAIYCNG